MTTRGHQPPTDTRRWLDEHGNEIDETDRGLVYDLRTLADRRRVLGLFGGFSDAALLAACGGGSGGSGQGSTATTAASGATTTTAGSAAAGGDLSEVPDKDRGPLPGDGSNGPNVLDDSGVVAATSAPASAPPPPPPRACPWPSGSPCATPPRATPPAATPPP
jgi:hypothetical protein